MRMKRIYLVIIFSLASAVLLTWYSGWFAVAYHVLAVQFSESGTKQHGSKLRDYRVAIDAKQIKGIADNASGLTFDPIRKTLFTVINKPAQVAELDTSGQLLRTIPLRGASDVEGISHQEGNYFIIADEGTHQMILIEITDKTTEIDISLLPRFGLAIDVGRNVGYEGLSWDSKNHRLFAVKE